MTSEEKRQRQRERYYRWRASRPNYQQQCRDRQRADRDEFGWTSRCGTLPLPQRIDGKLPYSITVKRPLKPSERVIRDRPPNKAARRHNTNEPNLNTSEIYSDDFDD